MSQRACHTCDFWDAGGDRKTGWCRANPPFQSHEIQNARDGVMRIISNWPPTNPGDWCGRFTPMPEPDRSNVAVFPRPLEDQF